MLNYIATESTAKLIKQICKNQNMLILYETQNITNISKYLKETKVNFNLIKYFIIEMACLENSEEEIIESIYNFSRLHINTRIIILAQGFNNQSMLLNQLYEKGIYNIINSTDESEIEQQLIKALSETGIQKKEAQRFEKIEEIKNKTSKLDKLKQLIPSKKIVKNNVKELKEIKTKIENQTQNSSVIHQSGGVYFFALLLEAVTRFIRLICYVLVFLLTSIGITILMNPQLRDLVFQILGLR